MKKSGAADIEKRWKEMSSSDKTDREVLDSSRLGTIDYDFNSINIIKEGGQAIVFEVKSKVDGKTYAGKRLQYVVGS